MQGDQLWKVAMISETLLKQFIDFLTPFQNATLDLEKFKEPTLHKVAFWRFQLINHLKPVVDDQVGDNGVVIKSKDPPLIIAYKRLLKPLVNEKMKLDVLHVLGTLLDPVLKHHMRKLEVPNHMIVAAKEKLKALMGLISTGVDLSLNIEGNDDDPVPSQTKKRRIGDQMSMYDQLEDDTDDSAEPDVEPSVSNFDARVEAEITMYEKYKVTDLEKKEVIEAAHATPPPSSKVSASFRILWWWNLKGALSFPIMSRVARSILCIPAASSKSECNFSNACNTLTPKFLGLKPAIVNDLKFLRSNQDLQSS